MSTGLNCEFIEPVENRWYYVLEDWGSPKGAWDWREYATAYGPFGSFEEARSHLDRNHANPGGYCRIPAKDYHDYKGYQRLIAAAAR